MATTTMKKPVNNYLEIQQMILRSLTDTGSGSTSVISEYPTKPGVYRVGSISGLVGMPSGATGYGALICGNAGSYTFHIYIDNSKRLYWGITSATDTASIVPPLKWRYVEGTEVNPISAS